MNHQIFERKLRFWVALEARLSQYRFNNLSAANEYESHFSLTFVLAGQWVSEVLRPLVSLNASSEHRTILITLVIVVLL